MGFLGSSDGKQSGFDPWVRKIPWRRVWQPSPVFLPGESLWTEEPGGLQSMGLQRVRHDLAIKHTTHSVTDFKKNLGYNNHLHYITLQ